MTRASRPPRQPQFLFDALQVSLRTGPGPAPVHERLDQGPRTFQPGDGLVALPRLPRRVARPPAGDIEIALECEVRGLLLHQGLGDSLGALEELQRGAKLALRLAAATDILQRDGKI